MLTAKAGLEVERRVGRVQLRDGEPRSEGRPDSALRIVAVCDRRPEHRYDRVADELLHCSADYLDLRAQRRVVAVQDAADVLGIQPLGACGEADQVGKQNGDDLPLLARVDRGRAERLAARIAEAGVVGVLAPAGRANGHARSLFAARGV